jgi:hypothetical protein
MNVFLVNGHSRFPVAKISKALIDKKIDFTLFHSFYPKTKTLRILKKTNLVRFSIIKRLINRVEDFNIPDNKIVNLYSSEVLHQLAVYLYKKNNKSKIAIIISYISLLWFRFIIFLYLMFFILNNNKPNYFYFRSGYGGINLYICKFFNITTICDHSIANPEIIDYLINNDGKLPKNRIKKISLYNKPIAYDIKNSSKIIVNSEFVKTTLKKYNKSLNVEVIYHGLDKKYKSIINSIQKKIQTDSNLLNIAFIGTFNARKGATKICEIIKKIKKNTICFNIVGSVDKNYKYILSQNNVTHFEHLNYNEIAKLLLKTKFFIFPTLAEGSARVVYLAMASGNIVITTKNAGSIITNGKSGIILEHSNFVDSTIKIINNYHKQKKDLDQIGIFAKKTAMSNRHSEDEYISKISKLF